MKEALAVMEPLTLHQRSLKNKTKQPNHGKFQASAEILSFADDTKKRDALNTLICDILL
jgi:hypothetical protein